MVAAWREASDCQARMRETRPQVALMDRAPPDPKTQGISKMNIDLKIMAFGLKAQLLSSFIG